VYFAGHLDIIIGKELLADMQKNLSQKSSPTIFVNRIAPSSVPCKTGAERPCIDQASRINATLGGRSDESKYYLEMAAHSLLMVSPCGGA
jgi:hypothetical protein